jgi:hypothetical protein
VLLGCVLVDNPSYLALDDEASTSTSETSGSTSTSTSETSETTTLDTSSSSESGDACPPGQAGSLGCQCVDGLLCDEGLACVDGVCAAPVNCPPEQSVGVAISLGNNALSPDLQVGVCATTVSVVAPDTLVIDTGPCDGPVNAFSLALAPYPIDQLPAEWLDTNADVYLRALAQDEVYLRMSGTFDLWLTHASALDPGAAELADYPLTLAEGLGDCPPSMEPCGVRERRGLQAGDALVFDGNAATLGDASSLWVAEAELMCGTPRYTFAWIRP